MAAHALRRAGGAGEVASQWGAHLPAELGTVHVMYRPSKQRQRYFVDRLGWSLRTVTRWPRSDVPRSARTTSSAM